MGDEGGDVVTRIEKSIDIKTPPEAVWELLVFDRFSEWDVGTQKHVKSMEYTSAVQTPEDKHRVGATIRITENRGRVYHGEITESLDKQKIVFNSSEMGGVLTFLLEPTERGTKVTYAMDYELPWGLLGKFLNVLFAQRMSEKEVEGSLAQLKSLLET